MKRKTQRYGRGKFDTHPKYIEYMEFIVSHPSYTGMPNAVDKFGHIYWQVSSGKTTSFYKYYKERFQWWVEKADDLELKGNENSDDRFSLAARLIHPTKYRTCRLCGKQLNVGYYYLNKLIVKRWNKLVDDNIFYHKQPIDEAIRMMNDYIEFNSIVALLTEMFPNRKFIFDNIKSIVDSFNRSIEIRSTWLSPGFMCNPPDRLDGFHDYGLCCRKSKDPGRSDENLRSYSHDRRAFIWWAEGNWKAADTLYNSAENGECIHCKKIVEKISPDHIGPLSCGFKHLPFFNPVCQRCNASKNRRFSKNDIDDLIEYEKLNDDSVASWQIRLCWDSLKNKIENDEESKELSDLLRGIEDYFIRFLHNLKERGFGNFLRRFLRPELAHQVITYQDLNTSTMRYKNIIIKEKKTNGSRSLESRALRIAFNELDVYVTKKLKDRKVRKITNDFDKEGWREIEDVIGRMSLKENDIKWNEVLGSKASENNKDKMIRELLDDEFFATYQSLSELERVITKHFNSIGQKCSDIFINNYLTSE